MNGDWDLGAGLRGRSVVVTGAAGGIGRAVTAGFAAAGALVTAADLDADRLDASLAELPDVRSVPGDLTRPETRAAVLDTADQAGPLFALVHCSAVLRRRSLITDVTEDDWDVQHTVNLKTTFFLCRDVAERMRAAQTPGRIVTFTSQSWWTGGFGGSIAYAASKGGIVSMTRGLARTYGPDGITVNAVSPGQARTEMLLTDLDPDVLESMTAQTPLGRIAEPEEVASAAIFLASQHASFITGSTLNVSGGFLMY